VGVERAGGQGEPLPPAPAADPGTVPDEHAQPHAPALRPARAYSDLVDVGVGGGSSERSPGNGRGVDWEESVEGGAAEGVDDEGTAVMHGARSYGEPPSVTSSLLTTNPPPPFETTKPMYSFMQARREPNYATPSPGPAMYEPKLQAVQPSAPSNR